MLDKYKKLKKKYPPPRWEYRYIRGKRVRIRAKPMNEFDGATEGISKNNEETNQNPNELDGEAKAYTDESFEEGKANPDGLFEEAEANRNELFEEAEANRNEYLKEAEAISNENIEANLSS